MAEDKSNQGFTKVEQLRPQATGLNLIVKVVSEKIIAQRGRSQGRLAECIVGDETGRIIFTARNDQVDLMKEGATVILHNAKIDLFKGSMRLAVDKFGRIESAEPASFSVHEDGNKNLSLLEWDCINVVE